MLKSSVYLEKECKTYFFTKKILIFLNFLGGSTDSSNQVKPTQRRHSESKWITSGPPSHISQSKLQNDLFFSDFFLFTRKSTKYGGLVFEIAIT